MVDSVAAHRDWAAVAVGVHGRSAKSFPPTTRWCSAISTPTSWSTPTAGSTPWRPSPPSFPAGATASSGGGRRTTQKNRFARQIPDVTSVTVDGAPAPYRMLWEDGRRFRIAKIGDPDKTLSFGTHVFEIRYSIAGALDPGGTGADLRFAESTGDNASAPSVFYLGRHRRLLGQQNSAGRHLGDAAG